jgi:hypothetical protein
LNATGSGTVTWQNIFPGNTVIGTGNSYNTGLLSSGVYTYYAFDNNSCSHSFTPAIVTVTALPVPTINVTSSKSIVCIGDTALLTATGANSFTWSTFATGITSVITPTFNNSYSVTGTASNGCKNTSYVTVLVMNCGGVDLNEIQNEVEQLMIFPNPGQGLFYLKTNHVGTVFLINSLGEKIRTYTGDLNNKLEINITDLSYGIYFLKPGNANSFTKIIYTP